LTAISNPHGRYPWLQRRGSKGIMSRLSMRQRPAFLSDGSASNHLLAKDATLSSQDSLAAAQADQRINLALPRFTNLREIANRGSGAGTGRASDWDQARGTARALPLRSRFAYGRPLHKFNT
jgi:hypothetical protein